MERKIKVAHIIARMIRGGADEIALFTVQGLDKDRYAVDLIIGEEFDKNIQKFNDQINVLKNGSFREQLLEFINHNKIHLSQLLGNLERKVEDFIEIKEFKRSTLIIQKRAKEIEIEIKNFRDMFPLLQQIGLLNG